jgi:GLE1-like protein/CCCH-type zinc finger
MLTMVSKDNKEIIPVFAAHIYTVCPTAIPSLPHSSPDASEEQFMKSLGMLQTNKPGDEVQFESFERFLARTEGVISLVANVMASQPSSHVLLDGHEGAIPWLKRFLSLLPEAPQSPLPVLTAPVLDAFLRGAGHMLANHHVDEFRTILDSITNDVVNRLDVSAIGMPSSTRLKKTIEGGFDGFKTTLPSHALPELYYGAGGSSVIKGLGQVSMGNTSFSSSNPIGSNNTSSKSSPFTSTANQNSNPFGASTSGTSFGATTFASGSTTSPFGNPTITSQSPFGTGGDSNKVGSSPFGTGTSSYTSDTTTNNATPFGSGSTSWNSTPFGGVSNTSNPSPFGDKGSTMDNSMSISSGVPNPSPFGGGLVAQNPSPFGGAGLGSNPSTMSDSSIFGASGSSPFSMAVSQTPSLPVSSNQSPFGTSVMNNSPFGSSGMNQTPFGGVSSSPFTASNTNPSPFGGVGGSTTTPSPFGGSVVKPSPSPFGGPSNLNPSPFGNSTSSPFGNVAPVPSPFGSNVASNVGQSPFGMQQQGKTKPPCKFFAQGRCTKGANCQFSHDTQPGNSFSNPFGGPRR